MTNTKEDIEKVILANLPSQTAGVMKEYLEKAEIALSKEERYNKDYNYLLNKNEKLKEENEKLKNKLLTQDKINEQLKDIQKRELMLDKEILEIKLKSTEKITETVISLTETVFKNRKLVIDKSNNVPFAVKNDEYVQNHSSSSFETQELE